MDPQKHFFADAGYGERSLVQQCFKNRKICHAQPEFGDVPLGVSANGL
jgi:hypothetical protein